MRCPDRENDRTQASVKSGERPSSRFLISSFGSI